MSSMPASWKVFHHQFEKINKRVFVSGDGPPIIIIHELPGMIVECVSFAERLRAQGFTVYLPLLFGQPNMKMESILAMMRYPVMMCIRRELYLFKKNTTSPIMDWLRNLSQYVNDQHQLDRVGAIGMCMTGGFVIPLMLDDFLQAPVMSQPAFPVGDTNLGIDPAVVKKVQQRCEAGAQIKAYRFSKDPLSKPGKIKAYQEAFGDALLYEELDSTLQKERKLGCHAVFTGDFIDQAGSPSTIACADLVAFFNEKLKAV
ncbi:MAG: dienelactone hydrolase family protein [Bacteroidota bacterium]